MIGEEVLIAVWLWPFSSGLQAGRSLSQSNSSKVYSYSRLRGSNLLLKDGNGSRFLTILMVSPLVIGLHGFTYLRGEKLGKGNNGTVKPWVMRYK